MEIKFVAFGKRFKRLGKKLYVVLETDEFAGFEQMFTANPAKFRIVQNQIRKFRALLHEINLSKPFDFVMEAVDADEFSENDSGIVETEGLVKIAGQKILLHHGLLPLSSPALAGPTPR